MERERPDVEISNDTSRNKFQIVCISLCLILEDIAKGAKLNRRIIPNSRSIV